MWQWKATDPAPSMVAANTAHMAASFILLDGNIALGTSMSAKIVSPALELIFLKLFACLFEMPLIIARKTNVLSALIALNFLCPLWSLYDIFTGRDRTELLVGIGCYFVIKHLFFEFLILVLAKRLQYFSSLNLELALLIRAFYLMALTRLIYHIIHVILETLTAEVVSALKIWYIGDWSFVVANITFESLLLAFEILPFKFLHSPILIDFFSSGLD